MINAEISRLIATGQAQPAVYYGVSAANILRVPKSAKGIIIYGVKLRAFCDLPTGRNFTTLNDVEFRLWHQLRIISEKATQTFHAKWNINPVLVQTTPITTYYLPIGSEQWGLWFNSEKDIIFEISGISQLLKSMTLTTAAVSAATPQNYPEPPAGYGKNGVPGAVPVVETTRLTAGPVAGQFEVRAFNDYTPKNIPSDNSYNSMQWPVNATTALNPPQYGIVFGQFTAPLLEVQYLIYNKAPNFNFAPPL